MNGVLYAIAAGIGFGFFQTMNRKAGQDIDPLRGTLSLLVVSAIILAVIAMATTDLNILWSAPPGAILAFVIAGFIHFFVGWTLISISQNQIGAARTGAVVGTMPLFGLVIDLVIYRETFSLPALLGVFLVVAGVYIVSYR